MHLLLSYALAAAPEGELDCAEGPSPEVCTMLFEGVAPPMATRARLWSSRARFPVGNTCGLWAGGKGLDSIYYGHGYRTMKAGIKITWIHGLPHAIHRNYSADKYQRLWNIHFNGKSKVLMKFYMRRHGVCDYS